MFCLCGPRSPDKKEKSQESMGQFIATSLQANMRIKSMREIYNKENCGNIENQMIQQWQMNKNEEPKEYQDFISYYNQSNLEKSEIQFFQSNECSDIKYEESKTNNDKPKLIHLGDGLLGRIISINQQTTSSCKDSFSPFIMKVLNETKRFYNITPTLEVQFVKQLVPHFITELTYQRVKNDKLLITHDPTGSFLIKHILSNQMVYYIQESKTYRNILDKAFDILKCQEKINYIVKSDIIQKLDTVILNLLYLHEIPISFIVQEYLTLAHDMIIIISPKIEFNEIISQLRQGIKTSVQSKLYCSVEIQNIYNGNNLIARIIYFGEVSHISQNQQLSFLYDCISINIKKTFKYKKLIKDLKNMIGIMKLVDLFALYGLLNYQSEEYFIRFYKQIKLQYFQDSRSLSYKRLKDQTSRSQSQTESENEDSVPLVLISSSILQETKPYSKSLSTGRSKIEYVHFHSQNNDYQKIKVQTQDKVSTSEKCINNEN